MILAVYLGHGMFHPVCSIFDSSPNQFLGEVLLKLRNLGNLRKKSSATFVVARVKSQDKTELYSHKAFFLLFNWSVCDF